MKTVNRFSIIMAIILLLFNITSCRENLKPIGHIVTDNGHIITLNVDTKRVAQNNTDKTCNFGQTDGSTNKDWTITVKVGDSITWRGLSTYSTKDSVKIKMIKIKKNDGTKIFDKDSIKGKKKVFAKAKYSTEDKSDYEYKIKFTVIRKGKKKNYHIDPKIRVNQ